MIRKKHKIQREAEIRKETLLTATMAHYARTPTCSHQLYMVASSPTVTTWNCKLCLMKIFMN